MSVRNIEKFNKNFDIFFFIYKLLCVCWVRFCDIISTTIFELKFVALLRPH